jgi:hypothetical protein
VWLCCACDMIDCLCVPRRRKIVTSDGTIMEPVDFEKAGDRATTRNWQLSICVTGRGSGQLPGTLSMGCAQVIVSLLADEAGQRLHTERSCSSDYLKCVRPFSCPAGLNAKSGSRTELKLGHATRILGVHNITQPNSPMASR